MQQDTVIQLPDLQFVKWCEETFMINRGVYNTIDEKLYAAGYEKIEVRRSAIVQFLQKHVQTSNGERFYKFGPGNLTSALEEFKRRR